MELKTLSDWLVFLGFRVEECRQMCACVKEKDGGDMLDEYCDLYQDAERQIRMLCDRAHKITRRARKLKETPNDPHHLEQNNREDKDET